MQNYREYIQPISEYDVKHGTELLETLETYIRCCSATSAICESLFIHKNTLYSRMSKISQLIKHDLSDSDTLFNINLALKVKMLIDSGILKI
jgi:DNA-binding PucR family transcriptional regulator